MQKVGDTNINIDKPADTSLHRLHDPWWNQFSVSGMRKLQQIFPDSLPWLLSIFPNLSVNWQRDCGVKESNS